MLSNSQKRWLGNWSVHAFSLDRYRFFLGNFGHVMLVCLQAARCVVMVQIRSVSLAFSIIRSFKTHFLWPSSLCKCINISGGLVIYNCWISVLKDNSWILDVKCSSHIWKKCFDIKCVFKNISYLHISIKCFVEFEIIMVSLVVSHAITMSSLGGLCLYQLCLHSSLSYFGKCKRSSKFLAEGCCYREDSDR